MRAKLDDIAKTADAINKHASALDSEIKKGVDVSKVVVRDWRAARDKVTYKLRQTIHSSLAGHCGHMVVASIQDPLEIGINKDLPSCVVRRSCKS